MTGRRLTLQGANRVGLVGGTPYQRDLVQGWLAETPRILSITPIINGQRRTRRAQQARNGSGVDIDLVVGIVDGPDDPALSNCRQLTDAGRSKPFIAVLLTPGQRVLQAAIDAGAGGLVAAASGPRTLADGVAAVAGGAAWLDPSLSPIVMKMARSPHADRFGLTPTEARVAACFGDGLSNREIGDRLEIAEETVKTHVSNIYRKLDVCDRASAVALLQDRLPRLQAAVRPEFQRVGS